MATLTLKYLKQYKDKAAQTPGKTVPAISQIITAMFKTKIEKLKITKKTNNKDYNSQSS